MDFDHLPEPMRRYIEERDAKPPLDRVSTFLGGYFGDAESFDEVRGQLQQLAQTNIRAHQEELEALESVINNPPAEKNVLSRLVGWDANWVLDDESDAGALQFLRQVAQMLREVIEEAPASAERW